jgi:glutamine synthetase
MAKPIAGEPGSAMHIHTSVVDIKTGKNIFAGPKGVRDRSLPALHRRDAEPPGAAVALLAPYVNSYRRYVPDFAAPINLEWGRDNRTTGLRVPDLSPAARRVENRLPGMDCNPYLGIASTLACGYLGLMDKTRPARIQRLAYIDSEDLPVNLGDALDLLDEDRALQEVLGVDFCARSTIRSSGTNTRSSCRSSARGSASICC